MSRPPYASPTATLPNVLCCVLAGGLILVSARNPQQLFAQAAQGSRVEIEALLAAGWKPSPSGYQTAVGHFEAAQRIAPGDVRAPFAMALVSLQNRKYPEAARYLDQALASDKPLLPIRQVRISVAILMKDVRSAKQQLETLVEFLSEPELPDDGEKRFRESAQFAGTVAWYLQLVASLKEDEAAALAARLPGQRREAWNAGQAEANLRAETLKEELTAAREKALTQDAAKNAETKNKFEALLAPAKKQAEVAAEAEKTYRDENEKDRAEHEPKAREGLKAIAQLESQIAQRNKKIRDLEREIDDAEKKARKDKKSPPSSVSRDRGEVAKLNQEVQLLQAQLRQIEANPSVAFMRKYHAQLAALTQATASTAQQLSQLQLKNSRLFKPGVVDDKNAATTALELKTKAYSSYVDLHLDAERDRILETFRGK